MKHKNVEEDVFNFNPVDLQLGFLYHLEKWRRIQELGVRAMVRAGSDEHSLTFL